MLIPRDGFDVLICGDGRECILAGHLVSSINRTGCRAGTRIAPMRSKVAAGQLSGGFSMHDFRWPALVTLGAVLLMFVMAWNVGKARAKFGVNAPATTGNPEFERVFRVQMNTLENVLMFLPSLWLFAAFVSEIWAAALGLVWLAARLWYSIAYQQAAARRGPAFGLSMLVVTVLALGAAWGVVRTML
jgi:hypothetical protein